MTTRIIVGNALEVLPTLEKNSAHCSVTSPPYYGLRKYDGDQVCDWPEVEYAPMPGLPPVMIEAMTCALGHEPTIEAYVGHLVAIYREVWQVLRDDGVAWVVMGDSYIGYKGSNYNKAHRRGTGEYSPVPSCHNQGTPHTAQLKAGDLMLVPHRLALALQAAGWTVRNDVVWAKVAPMPESVSGWRWERHKIKVATCQKSGKRKSETFAIVSGDPHKGRNPDNSRLGLNAKWTDCPGCPKCETNDGYILKRGSWRHTRAHEVVFMLSKGMGYWANQEVVREALAEASIERMNQSTFHEQSGGAKDYGSGSNRSVRKALENLEQSRNGRNPRSVLSPSPEPFPGSHFAVFPTGLIEPLIKATCPTRCCPECGKGWSPVVERKVTQPGVTGGASWSGTKEQISKGESRPGGFGNGESNILGYRPTCGCGMAAYDAVPGVVLDLFIGSGTTGLVCDRLGLDCIGIDISERYAVDIARGRIVDDAPLLADVTVVMEAI